MRIVQIIDSLEIGGAERMAVNYANALGEKIEFSGLIATRSEGEMLNQISKKVSYLFLNKKRKIDFKAIFKLKKYLKQNRVNTIHAHSSSFFTAVLVKLIYPKIKVIWHDHYGPRIEQTKKDNIILIFCSLFFASIFVVNKQLKEWNMKNMKCKNVVFVPNFIQQNHSSEQITELKGIEGKRIVFLANLKTPKNHIVILKSFFDLKLFNLGWSLHLIGKDYHDQYSQVLKDFIQKNNLVNHVHLYGTRKDIRFILSQASIGVLASTFEGFPVTLIEYGESELAVLCTNVGFCSDIIKNEERGLLFDPKNEFELLAQFKRITADKNLRREVAYNLKNLVQDYYTEDKAVEKILKEYYKVK
ncbi:glycosyltransferase [Flavobacterium sp.]|uniref:glycosyltransferase n=1 Tax=Flavobacterium sp. TaxID=239 RepID=UPI0031D5C040